MNPDTGSVGKNSCLRKLSIPAIKKHLTTKHVGRELHFAESLVSTNKTLIEKAKEGACHGTVVLAETQTGGRGRQKRLWHSPSGVNLYFSVLLRPAFSPDKAPPITLASAVATAEAVEIVTGARPMLKWPNDLLLGGNKLSGILTEISADIKNIHWIVLGIGLNINTMEFPPELKTIATSLRLYTGRCHPRELLLATILERLEHWFTVLTEEGAAVVIDAWKAKPNILGQLVTIKSAGKRRRAGSRIRSQDRGRRGARPARREEGERLAVQNPVRWIFTAASTDRTEFGPSQYIDVFNRRASRSCTKSSVLDFCRRDNEDAPLGAPQLTQQVGLDRRPNPEVIFESARNISGLAKDLDDDGALLLETRDGVVEKIISGDLIQNNPRTQS